MPGVACPIPIGENMASNKGRLVGWLKKIVAHGYRITLKKNEPVPDNVMGRRSN
jgi:hypothetical protein